MSLQERLAKVNLQVSLEVLSYLDLVGKSFVFLSLAHSLLRLGFDLDLVEEYPH